MSGIKRNPQILGEQAAYAKISKADFAEVAFSFARMIYGENLSDSQIMEKVQKERELLKLSQGRK